MTLASGQLPYDYAHGQGPFRVANPYQTNFPVGPSGVLLEQVEFVITAERRKLMKHIINGNSYLDDYFLYVNPIITHSGGFEPKADGSTLGNKLYPGAAFILDHIHDVRISLTNFFTFLSQDTDYTSSQYRAAWLQGVYPNSPSGYYTAQDPDFFSTILGQWSHRFPSETGNVLYTNDDVLGASGILYDVDFGEVMFNPAPHMASFVIDTMHSQKVNGQNDGFGVQMYPIFPAFQKTDGTIVTLTGREPASIPQSIDYNIAHMSSGAIRFDGYAFFGNTQLYIGQNGQIFDASAADFTTISEGLRQVLFGGNVAHSRIFAIPTSQTSGVYRVAARNRFIDFPTTTIESGLMSVWPNITSYWPNTLIAGEQLIGSTTTPANLGYHVFDDCIWMTDTANGVSPTTGFPSGLAILSPFTGHRLWVRYADQTAIPCMIGGSTINKNWSTCIGLTRLAADKTYRVHPNFQQNGSSISGQCLFGKYDDLLDLIATIPTTSIIVQPDIANEFPLGTSTQLTINDHWHDDSADEYWISNSQNPGVDMWKFNSVFNYINKYVFNSPSGIFNARGFFQNGNHFLFHGQFGPGGTSTIIGSGIYPVHILSEGTDPFGDDAIIPNCGSAAVYPWEVKHINGAPFVGVQTIAEILDIFFVPAATHVYPGVYATINWRTLATDISTYLVRIEEATDTWEIKSISRMETSVQASQRRELLYMPY